MGVILVSTELYPSYYVGGLGVAVRNYFEAYKLAGINVSVIAICRDGSEEGVYCAEPDSFVYSNLNSVVERLTRLADLAGVSRDVIHANDWYTYPAAEHIKERSGGAIVLSIHLPHFDAAERKAVDGADLIIAVSNYELSMLANTYGNDIRNKAFVVYNVTDWTVGEARQLAERIFGSSKRDEARRKIIGFVNNRAVAGRLSESCEKLVVSWGRLTGQKNHVFMVPLAEKLERDTCVLIAGRHVNDPYADVLASMIEMYSTRGRIALVRDLDTALIKAVAYASNVAVFPYVFEPFGIASIESQAIGTPVVVNAENGLAETVAPPSVAVSISETDKFFKAVQDLADKTHEEDLEGVERVRKKAVSHVERRFRISRLAEDLKKIYSEARARLS
jgi:glycosyltransferase involved in cell wall biosynthesis